MQRVKLLPQIFFSPAVNFRMRKICVLPQNLTHLPRVKAKSAVFRFIVKNKVKLRRACHQNGNAACNIAQRRTVNVICLKSGFNNCALSRLRFNIKIATALACYHIHKGYSHAYFARKTCGNKRVAHFFNHFFRHAAPVVTDGKSKISVFVFINVNFQITGTGFNRILSQIKYMQ